MLRTAQALADANVPARRITRSLRELRRHLPEAMPLSGLRIGAVADRVVVREGSARWQAESGQYLLAFEGDPADGSLSVVAPAEEEETSRAEDWFAKAVALESEDVAGALRAYAQAIDVDTSFVDAYVNCGRLLHDNRHFANAERVYRAGIKACGGDPVLLFNLGVLLEDMVRGPEAMEAYEAALRADPALADCHYNLALLCEKLAKPKEAIRHMARYRLLVGNRSK